MAARLNPRNSEVARQKIQTTQLIKRLQNHAHGEVEMTSTQVDAAKFLINKSLSNPAQEINLGGQQDNPLQINQSIVPALTKEEWLAAFAPHLK